MSDLQAVPEYDFLDDEDDQINYDECAAVLEFENNSQGQIRRHIATLECDENDDVQNEEIPIYPGNDIRVGRNNKCDVVIEDDRVSKQHFRIYSIIYDKETRPDDPPLIYCEDLQSFNGTFVNDVLIGNIYCEKVGHLLSDGDVVEIRPHWKFRFHQPIHQSIGLDKALTHELKHFEDRYVVYDRRLGDGEYGAVWLAQEVTTRKQVACKIVDLNHATKRLSESHFLSAPGEMWEHGLQQARDERLRVLREIKILAQLSHPHIVDLKKAFCSTSTLYMFTALAAGGDLFSYLVAQGDQLDDWNSRVITRQIVLAMTYIHSKGIAHRDIKPENILVTQTDFGGRVVLTDFGFANHVNARTGRMMSRVGTQGYIAPEIWADGGHTMAADIWSFGVLTVRILTGLSVRDGIETTMLDDFEIADLFVEAGDRYSREQWLSLPPRALQFIQRLLIIDPEQRMTASDTLKHEWYKMPLTEAAELEEGYQRVIASWKGRETSANVIEDLPGRVTAAPAPTERAASKIRRGRIPDASLSPYFGLDRHLIEKIPSRRKDILANLSQSGSRFITETSQDKNPVPNALARRDRIVPITSVEASDIFGKSLQPALDLVELVPATPIASPEKTHESPVTSPLESGDNSLISDFDIRSSSQAKKRKQSWDPDDRRIHDIVAKQLPRYTTAKVMKDAVNKMKGMAMVEGRAESVRSI